ncbi:MAG: helical backbone metal receptor [Candidatus Obscuribacterales bacterium]|nr:helical backbone metal receptor [Candidatus Obscuribacterales bacterium]
MAQRRSIKSLLLALPAMMIWLSVPVLASANQPPRLVSLAPSNTELLFSLGVEKSLVGVSTYCDYPPDAQKIEKAGSFVSVNIERISRLKPNLVVLVKGQESLGSLLEHKGFKVLIIPNDHLGQIPANLVALGDITGQQERAKQLARDFNDSISSFKKIISKSSIKPRVFFCVWPEPLLTVGTDSFLNELIVTAGGINIVTQSTKGYPHYSLEKLLLANPDLVIFPFEAKESALQNKSPWTSLRAIKQKRYYYLPNQKADRLSRPTLRIIEGLFWLAIKLHPELQPQLQTWLTDTEKKLARL